MCKQYKNYKNHPDAMEYRSKCNFPEIPDSLLYKMVFTSLFSLLSPPYIVQDLMNGFLYVYIFPIKLKLNGTFFVAVDFFFPAFHENAAER